MTDLRNFLSKKLLVTVVYMYFYLNRYLNYIVYFLILVFNLIRRLRNFLLKKNTDISNELQIKINTKHECHKYQLIFLFYEFKRFSVFSNVHMSRVKHNNMVDGKQAHCLNCLKIDQKDKINANSNINLIKKELSQNSK